jgi:hypothetical protein
MTSLYVLGSYNLYNNILINSIIRSGERVGSRNSKNLLNTFINITGEAEVKEY